MRIRTTLFAGLAVGAALLASTANAAPTAVITDAKGDAKGAQTTYDIVSVTMDTTRTSKAKTAPMKDFTITIEVAGKPSVQPGTSYQILGENAACGTFFAFSYYGVTGPDNSVQFGTCGVPDETGQDNFVIEPNVKVDGNKIIFTIPAKALPKEVKAGSLFSELTAYTAVTEPVFGYSPVDFAPNAAAADAVAIDHAVASKDYKLGS